MLDSLAFFAFCCEILITVYIKFFFKTCSIYPCFARFKTCVVECSTVLFGVAFVKMLKNTIEKKDSISPCFVGFENPCFEHRHWTFEWAAACLRGTRPAWQACLTLGRRQASPGTRPAAASLPNPSGDGKPTWHEATMASLPNPWGGGKPTWHEASMARLPGHFLFL